MHIYVTYIHRYVRTYMHIYVHIYIYIYTIYRVRTTIYIYIYIELYSVRIYSRPPQDLFALRRVMHGPRNGPTKSSELLDVALWELRIKQYIGTCRVYVHVTAVAIPALAFGMMLQPEAMPPLQVCMALFGWVQHHIVAAEKLKLTKMKMRLIVLAHYVQCGAFVYFLPSDCEPWSPTEFSVFFRIIVLTAS